MSSSPRSPWAARPCVFVHKVLDPEAISLGWASLVLSIWFLGGVIISFLGVIGIYLAKVFNETKGRPLYVVKAVDRRGGGVSEDPGDLDRATGYRAGFPHHDENLLMLGWYARRLAATLAPAGPGAC